MAALHAYTLLIVESPTVARIIRHFDLPYLEVIATDGFCWQPEYDRGKHRLKARAIPEKRAIRRSLKQKSAWASRTVIATDDDAAGAFIAHTLGRHLRRHELYRASLTGLSRENISRMLDQATLYEAGRPWRLRNRFVLHETIKSYPLGWEQLALLSYFFDRHPRHSFVDHRETLYETDQPVPAAFESRLRLHIPAKPGPCTHYRVARPLSTASTLARVSGAFPGRSYTWLQEELNRLFTTAPEELGHGLISYPRTQAQGFFPATWSRLESAWLKKHSLESFRPPVVRDIVQASAPHESLHPLLLDHVPAAVRPYVKKDAFSLYRVIYEHHLSYLRLPKPQMGTCWENEKGTHFFNDSVKQEREPDNVHVSPRFTTGAFLNFLVKKGGVRPSRIGSVFDRLSNGHWINAGSGTVEPGREAFRYLSRIKDVKIVTQCVNRLQELATDPDLKASAVRQLLNEILM